MSAFLLDCPTSDHLLMFDLNVLEYKKVLAIIKIFVGVKTMASNKVTGKKVIEKSHNFG